MNPSLRQLQILVHVHRAGNLTRAATQLGLTQAAVSLQLQQLEKIFGLRLFDRTTRELVPTAAGLQAIAAAEQILGATATLTNQMQNLNGASAGKLAMAVSAGFASTFLPQILGKFRTAHPGVEIALYDVPAHALIEKLLTTEAEFALGGMQGKFPDVTVERILRGRICAIGIARELGAKKQMSWDELSALPSITMRRENLVRATIDAALARSNRRFRSDRHRARARRQEANVLGRAFGAAEHHHAARKSGASHDRRGSGKVQPKVPIGSASRAS